MNQSKGEGMAKLTEKMLYETWLDISFATELYEDYLHDFEINIKLLRKSLRKSKKLLTQSAEHYKSINGRYPTRLRK